MIDLNLVWIDIECPQCKYINEIQFIDAKSEKTVFCHNCKTIIQLKDKNASVHNGVEAINSALINLEKKFKKK